MPNAKCQPGSANAVEGASSAGNLKGPDCPTGFNQIELLVWAEIVSSNKHRCI